MVEVEFVLRGTSVQIDEVEDLRERAILKQIERSIVDRVGGTRCAKHGQFPKLIATGPRADELHFDLSGCCQELLTKTAAALS